MNRSFRNLSTLALCLLAILALGTAAPAQTFRGTILGTVTDSSGASVPGASVTIRNIDTGLVRTVVTSDDGSYTAPELPLGNYTISIEKAGFKTGKVTAVKVEVNSELRADVVLQTGELTQTVEVIGGELPMVESTSNTLGGIAEGKTAEFLLVNGRVSRGFFWLVHGAA